MVSKLRKSAGMLLSDVGFHALSLWLLLLVSALIPLVGVLMSLGYEWPIYAAGPVGIVVISGGTWCAARLIRKEKDVRVAGEIRFRRGASSSDDSYDDAYMQYRARRDHAAKWERRYRRFPNDFHDPVPPSADAKYTTAEVYALLRQINFWRASEPEQDADTAAGRAEYRRFVSADPTRYRERLQAAEMEINSLEAESGIEDLGELLGAPGVAIDPDAAESREAMSYAASSVLGVFGLIGPPPPGVSRPFGDGNGGVPDPSTGVPSGGRCD